MLMEEFKDWCEEYDQECTYNNFIIFYQNSDDQNYSIYRQITELAYQIHNLQVCMEGLIEDSEQERSC